MMYDPCVSRECPDYLASTLRDPDSPGIASEASGKRRVAVVPRSGVDVMISVPPWATMISWSPAPSFDVFPVWNGSMRSELGEIPAPSVADRHAPAIEVGHDASGATGMHQCVADQIGQGAPDRSFDAVDHESALLDLLQREFDSSVQRGGAEIREDVPRHHFQIDGPLFDRMIL
jgi:hypothetical protein